MAVLAELRVLVRGQTETVRTWLGKRARYHVHFSPTSASCLNLLERFFSVLTEN